MSMARTRPLRAARSRVSRPIANRARRQLNSRDGQGRQRQLTFAGLIPSGPEPPRIAFFLKEILEVATAKGHDPRRTSFGRASRSSAVPGKMGSGPAS